MSELKFSEEAPLRKRGRPKGKNRIPLSKEERKARNAHYERQRRGAYTTALNHLATVLECPESMSGDNVVKTASRYIKNSTNTNYRESLDFLRYVDGMLMYQIEKLSSQLGISVDEIDNLEIDISEVNAKEIPEDILAQAKASVIPENINPRSDANGGHENEDDSAQLMRTQNNKKGRKKRNLEALNYQAYSSEEAATSQSVVPSTLLGPQGPNRCHSGSFDQPSGTSHKWASNPLPSTYYPTITSSNDGSMDPSRVGSSSSSSSAEYTYVSGCYEDTTSSVQWMNSNVTSSTSYTHPHRCIPTSSMLPNQKMTSYHEQPSTRGAASSSSLVPTITGSSSQLDIPDPVGCVTTPRQHPNHVYSNVSRCQPWIWPSLSVESSTPGVPSSESIKLKIPSPESRVFETLSPIIIPKVENTSRETVNAVISLYETNSPESFMHETPSFEVVSPEAYYETASSYETASCDTASTELVIPESIMPELLSHFPVLPTPESMSSTSPTNLELQWPSAEIQSEIQLQPLTQSSQPVVQPVVQSGWFGQQQEAEPQIDFNYSQGPIPDLEPMEFTWPKLCHESDQVINDFRQNEGLPENCYE